MNGGNDAALGFFILSTVLFSSSPHWNVTINTKHLLCKTTNIPVKRMVQHLERNTETYSGGQLTGGKKGQSTRLLSMASLQLT
jgi:hypothetical protein